jgi:hypothetical protein
LLVRKEEPQQLAFATTKIEYALRSGRFDD